MLDTVIDLLACPHCEGEMELRQNVVACDHGHTFDVARQGYVPLLSGGSTPFTGDTAEMIAARAAFLDAGFYDPIRKALTAACADVAAGGPARVLESGAGTGRYLASVLDALPESRGIGLDISKPAARRIARAHPRLGSVLADAWRRLPIRSGSLTHVLSVFAPRNAEESHRVLGPGGALVVVTPTAGHLRELVSLPGMVNVDDRKDERLAATLSERFERGAVTEVGYTMTLPRPALAAVAGMGPSAHHLTAAQRDELLASLPDPCEVSVAVTVSRWRRRDEIRAA